MKAKHNQAKSYFSYKNDEVELVELGQFLRETLPYKVEKEWYIIFNKKTGEYMGYTPNTVVGMNHKIRNPDLILIDKETKKLKLVIEIDGGVHDTKWLDSQKRNEEYFVAGVPLLVIYKSEVETNLFDIVDKKVRERLEKN